MAKPRATETARRQARHSGSLVGDSALVVVHTFDATTAAPGLVGDRLRLPRGEAYRSWVLLLAK